MKKGFTLIELLIVIAIIGILAVAIVPMGTNALKKSRDGARIAHVTAISKALSEYNMDTGSTVFSKGATTTDYYKSFACVGYTKPPGSPDLSDAVKAYFKASKPPSDPTGANKNFDNSDNLYYKDCSYFVTVGTTHFVVWAKMESSTEGNYKLSTHSNKFPSGFASAGSKTDPDNNMDLLFIKDKGGEFYFLRTKYVQ